jgi:hypothetical protein
MLRRIVRRVTAGVSVGTIAAASAHAVPALIVFGAITGGIALAVLVIVVVPAVGFKDEKRREDTLAVLKVILGRHK